MLSRTTTAGRVARSLAASSTRRFVHASASARQIPAALSNTEMPAPTSNTTLSDFGVRHVAYGVARMTDYVLEKGEGSWMHTSNGKLLDFTAGIGVTNLGHSHPRVTKAAQEQVATLVHGQCSIGFHRPYLELIERLLAVMPDPSLDTFFFWNSGSEAAEAAVKVARKATGKHNVIVMQGSYHGRTYGSSAMTKSKTVYFQEVGQGIPGIFATTFPYWHQMGLSQDTPEDVLVSQAVYQLELLLQQQTAPQDTAAIVIEPVLGEGGYVPAPPAFLRALRQVCDKHGILLVIDEVQSGFGRTGKYFAIEHSGVRPDIMMIAKGIANGFPLSGIVSRKEIMDKMPKGSLGGTYAGSAVSCAAGVACADVMREEDVLGNVNARSAQLLDTLHNLQTSPQTSHLFADVRGLGLMIGVEFASTKNAIPRSSSSSPAASKPIPANIGSRVQKKCLEKGLMLLTTSCYDTIRFIPPLTLSGEEMAIGCRVFEESVREVALEG